MSTEPRRFFVVHMQKTAGTTLRDRFRNTFDEAQIYPNSTDGPALHSVIALSKLRERWEVRGDEMRLIAGHFPLSTTEVLGVPFVTLTVLRPPVERTLSYVRHTKKVAPGMADLTMEAIYDDAFRFQGLVQNHMVRMLSLTPEEMEQGDGALSTVPYTPERLEMAKEGLASLDLFGLQPRLDELFDELTERYGLDMGEPIRSNESPPEDPPPGLVDRIIEDNALDVALYDWAVQLYDERRAARTTST
jgi:hypothetical protein